MKPCYCGSGKAFGECCEPYLEGKDDPKTPEALMRSRFSAFATQNSDYILATEDASLHEGVTSEALKEQLQRQEWVCLEIHNSDEKSVTFTAYAFMGSHYLSMHEHSLFEKRDGRWFYIKGEQSYSKEVKVERNGLCPCGSGKKYKKCHGQK